jgi:hypothetical protein
LGQLSLSAAAGGPRISPVFGFATYTRIVVLTTALCALLAVPAEAPLAAGSTASANATVTAPASTRGLAVHRSAYPSARRVHAADHYIEQRAGRKAFAVDDGDKDGDDVKGFAIHSRFHSASVVNARLFASVGGGFASAVSAVGCC